MKAVILERVSQRAGASGGPVLSGPSLASWMSSEAEMLCWNHGQQWGFAGAGGQSLPWLPDGSEVQIGVNPTGQDALGFGSWVP